jgi:hypothetical protein
METITISILELPQHLKKIIGITYTLGFRLAAKFMKKILQGAVSFIFFIFFISAKAESNYELCLKNSNDSSCKVFFIRGLRVPAYEHPNLTSQATYYETPGLGFNTSWKENRKHKGWFFSAYDNDDIKTFGLKGRGEWIRSEDLAGVRDFKRIIGCWPIMGFKAPEFFSVTATPQGQAYLGGGMWGDDGKVLELNPLKFHATSIWVTGNLVRFGDRLVPDWHDEDATRVFGYNPKTRKLDSTVIESSVTYYPDEKLAGCERGLKLETKPGKKPLRPRHAD